MIHDFDDDLIHLSRHCVLFPCKLLENQKDLIEEVDKLYKFSLLPSFLQVKQVILVLLDHLRQVSHNCSDELIRNQLLLKISSFKKIDADLHPFFNESYLHHFVLQKAVAHRRSHQRANFDHFLSIPEAFLEVSGKELDLLVGDYLYQEIPVRLSQLRMSLDSQDKRSTASACITNEPSIAISYLLEYFYCQLRNSLVLTDEAWLDCIKT